MKKRLISLALSLALTLGCVLTPGAVSAADGDVNLAPEATVTASYSANWDNLLAVQKTDEPTTSAGSYKDQYSCAWQRGTHWVEYYFNETKAVSSARVLWFDDNGGYRCPTSAEIQWWDGDSWEKAGDIGVAKDTYNTATFSTPLQTNRVRVQMTNDNNSMGIKRFQVFGQTAAEQINDGPVVNTGLGYYAILPNKLLLVSTVVDDGLPNADALKITWEQISGPSQVVFQNPDKAVTYATATEAGKYEFRVTATDGQYTHSDTTTVNVYEEGSGYGNPILPGMFPDPHVYYDEENKKFYIFATSMENDNGAYGRASTWVSKDFVNWEMKLNNWPIEDQDGWGSIWAPDIVKNPNNGKYYQFITNSGGYNTWLAVSDSLDGPWEDALGGKPLIGDNGSNAVLYGGAFCMDAQPFIDDNNEAYVYWGWGEPRVAKLNKDFTGFESDVIYLKGTKWVADGGAHPQWAIVDLGQEYDITKITTAPEFRHVVYQYTIETSMTGNEGDWTMFADRTKNTDTVGQGTYVDEGTAKARYVKITINDSQNNWASLYELSVYAGDELVSLNKPVKVSSARSGDGGEKITDGSSGPALSDFTEGSYMVKHNGKYYLLYSSGTLNDGSYSVHYSVSDSPTGPFYTPDNNVILQSNAEQTTRGPGHNSVLKFGDDYYIVYHQHNQPHEEGDGVFRQTAADKLVFNDDGTIEAVTPTQNGIGALLPYQDQGFDLAQGKYATATSVRDANVAAEYALDHNNASKWKAKTNTYPQSLTVDLETVSQIQRIETSFEFTTLSYKYKIETSKDGVTWDTYVDKTDAFEAYDKIVSPHKDVKDAEARYVRITITGCERPENDASIYSFQVFGTPGEKEPTCSANAAVRVEENRDSNGNAVFHVNLIDAANVAAAQVQFAAPEGAVINGENDFQALESNLENTAVLCYLPEQQGATFSGEGEQTIATILVPKSAGETPTVTLQDVRIASYDDNGDADWGDEVTLTAAEATFVEQSTGGGGSTVTSYTITVTQSTGGKITPSTTSVTRGSNKTFTITADEEYAIEDVLVDGKSVGAVSAYTFKNVQKSHTIQAVFTKDTDAGKLPYIDVEADDWFAGAVQYVTDNKLMNGVSSSLFAPNSNMTRAMFVTVLARIEGVDTSTGKTWDEAGIQWAVENGISDGKNMDRPITREQMATMLYRYNGSPAVSGQITGFSDGAAVSQWALDGVKWAVEEGIIRGIDGALKPQGMATRAQVATMLMRMLEA